MTLDIDFQDEKYYLSTKLISCWDAPFENVIITNKQKKRILKNIAKELKMGFNPERIILQDIDGWDV